MRPTKWFVPFVALLMVVAGCSDSDEAAPDSANSGEGASTTSAADVGADAAYAERGPNEVGTIAFKLDDGRRVQAWYPAADSATDFSRRIREAAAGTKQPSDPSGKDNSQ